MAAGTYKSGVAIIYTYQAVGLATGKTITSTVYDEAHADSAQGGALAEIGATGRYWKSFTPDAEGEWIVVITNTTDGGGDVVKAYAVAGHDVDSLGDAVATLAGYIPEAAATEAKQDIIDTNVDDIETLVGTIDTEVGVIDGFHDVPGEDGAPDATIRDVVGKKTDTVAGTSLVSINKQVKAKTDNIPASPAPASEYDTEMARVTADVATEAKQDVIDGFHDVPSEDSADDAQVRDVVGKKSDTVAGTSITALAKQVLADTGTTGSIRGADDDTLKTLSDQIDTIAAPAMVG